MRLVKLTALALCTLGMLSASANLAPLPKLGARVDLERYAGDWYVHGNIPLKIPFFTDAQAYNYTESYRLRDDGTIEMTCAFNVGDFDGKVRSFTFKGKVVDTETFAEWDVHFMWPVKASYNIIYLDPDYNTTVVASADRKLAWIMSREAEISDTEFADLLAMLAEAGYATHKMRRVPHQTT
ncbi:MAG: lipocalin family protein [Gammaproteobacteria bacterium]|jgi:apolipoprotein D and lipocalin family protein|nr:lipocalin family protein [Gammaproteobacteria bacterium]